MTKSSLPKVPPGRRALRSRVPNEPERTRLPQRWSLKRAWCVPRDRSESFRRDGPRYMERHRSSRAISRHQVPTTFRALAEQNVAHTRELYEGSKNTLQAVLESWQKSFGAAGQGAATLNRRFIDLAERNINTGFDLATGLAGARNFGEVMELQATYWRKLLGELRVEGGQRRPKATARPSGRNQ